MRDAPIDVVSNAENRRLVTIVMDDAYTKLEPDVVKRAKQIARTAIDQLGPEDLAAVVFTYLGRSQNFTSDRSQLVQAIDSYTPKMTGSMGPPALCMPNHRSCDVETLATVASSLTTAGPGRKIVILISGGRKFAFGAIGDASSRSESFDLVRLFSDLQRANIAVYAYDTHGLEVDSSMIDKESLYSFAESTGGRAVSNTNDPVSFVADAFRESSTYYFIGFRTTPSSNRNEFRKLEVKVNRPELQVHTRNGYFAPLANTPARAEVVNGLPGGDLRLYATAAPVAVPDRREAEVIVAARIDPGDQAAATRTVELSAMAIDSEGKAHGRQQQTITVTAKGDSLLQPDLPAHLPLRPGRYTIRVAANSEGKSGSVFVDVEVPDFAKEPLSTSGLILQRHPAAPITDKVVADLVAVTPTTHRQFVAADDIGMFLRVYQGGKGKIVPVRVSAKVRDEQNSVRSTQDATLETADFSAARSADYRVSLPLAHLSPGAYLLEVEAQSGARRVQRTARFSVLK
jgi:VWFA-related protein